MHTPLLAYHSGAAGVRENRLAADTLTIQAIANTVDSDITATDTTIVTLASTATGLGNLRYELRATAVDCRADFGDEIEVVVRTDEVRYEGPLKDLSATSTGAGMWELSVSASPALQAKHGERCTIALHLVAWQGSFSAPAAGGFSATTHIELVLRAAEDIGMNVPATAVLHTMNSTPDEVVNTVEAVSEGAAGAVPAGDIGNAQPKKPPETKSHRDNQPQQTHAPKHENAEGELENEAVRSVSEARQMTPVSDETSSEQSSAPVSDTQTSEHELAAPQQTDEYEEVESPEPMFD